MGKPGRPEFDASSPGEGTPTGGDADSVMHTDDGRFIVVAGRKWRATDPRIPKPFKKELVNELMAARRAVGSAKSNLAATQTARGRVDDPKVALGERGEQRWDEPSDAGLKTRIRATIRALLRTRGTGKTISPSDVARCVGSPDWRPLMDRVRAVGAEMAERQE